MPLTEHRRWYEDLLGLGYTDVWSAETDGLDGFTPLALAAAWTPALQLGVAIIPAYTRGPALLAQSVAAMAEAAPGHFTFGLGTSSDVIVSRWNGVPFTEPYKRVRDTIAFLREALAGEKVDTAYDTFEVRGFRLARPVGQPPPIFLAALRPGMLRLAGRAADGVIVNWLSADRRGDRDPRARGGHPGGRPDLRDPERGRRHGPCRRPSDDHRLPQRGRVRRVPPVAGPWRGPRADVGAVEGRATARVRWRPSPTRWWTNWSCTGRTTSAASRSTGTWPMAWTYPVLAVLPFGVDLADAVEGLAPR